MSDPTEWAKWIYGKWFVGHSGLGLTVVLSLSIIVVTLFVVFVWLRGVDKYDDENFTWKNPPDISRAKNRTDINSIDKFDLNSISGLKDVSTVESAHFELSSGSSPNNNDSRVTVKTKEKFGTHLYVSVKFAALENVNTMDLIGDNICICINPGWNKYFIWESQPAQIAWQDIKIKKHDRINTLAIYQKERNVAIYINNEFVDKYKKITEPSRSQIGVQLKADRNGGKMHFDNLTIWEF